jgi:hypothetical protein
VFLVILFLKNKKNYNKDFLFHVFANIIEEAIIGCPLIRNFFLKVGSKISKKKFKLFNFKYLFYEK